MDNKIPYSFPDEIKRRFSRAHFEESRKVHDELRDEIVKRRKQSEIPHKLYNLGVAMDRCRVELESVKKLRREYKKR